MVYERKECQAPSQAEHVREKSKGPGTSGAFCFRDLT